MEKVKIFRATNDPARLEREVNTWIDEVSPNTITRVLQSQSGRLDQHVTLTIFYEKFGVSDGGLHLTDTDV